MPKYLFILVFMVVLLSGCSNDKMEVDRITSPVALGIDWDDNSNMIKVYAQVTPISSSGAGQEQSKKSHIVLEGKGETLLMAMTDVIDHSQQYLAWDHLLMIVFSEKMAKRGISEELDYLIRLDQVRFNCYLLITNDNLQDLLESSPKIESGLTTPLAGVSLISELSTHTKIVTLRDFIISYLSKETAPMIPIIKIYKIEKNQQQNEMELDYKGFGVFRNDTLIGKLDESETLGTLIVTGLKDQGSMVVPGPQGGKNDEITISGLITMPKIIPSLNQGKPSIKVEIEAEYDISQNPTVKEMDIHDIDNYNLQVSKEMKKIAEAAINNAQNELDADVFGFGGKIYRKYPDYWNNNKDNWQEIFKKIDVDVEVTAKLDNTGFSNSTLKYIFGKD